MTSGRTGGHRSAWSYHREDPHPSPREYPSVSPHPRPLTPSSSQVPVPQVLSPPPRHFGSRSAPERRNVQKVTRLTSDLVEGGHVHLVWTPAPPRLLRRTRSLVPDRGLTKSGPHTPGVSWSAQSHSRPGWTVVDVREPDPRVGHGDREGRGKPRLLQSPPPEP